MIRLTCLPKQVANWLHVLQPRFRHRHHLVLCWRLVGQAVEQEKATRTGLARLTPRQMAAWHCRRRLTAPYWHGCVLLWWFAAHVLATRPPPAAGVGSLVVESPRTEKTGPQHPLAQKGRLNADAPDIVGLPMVIVRRHGGHYRMPVDCAIVRRQDAPPSRSENRLFRGRWGRFRRPAWANAGVVVADAAGASTAKVQRLQRRGDGVVIAVARTWRCEQGRTMTALVTHLPQHCDRRCWVAREARGRRRPYGTLTTRARLRHRGDVTLRWRKKRRHDGPQPTKLVVTHLPDARARQVVDGYRRRWSGDLLLKALTGAMGLGQQQVTKTPHRSERSVASAVMASLRLLKFRAHAIPEPGPWSAFMLTQNCPGPLGQAPMERSVEPRLRRGRQQRRAAE